MLLWGGKPRFALVSLGLPKNAKTKEVTQLYRGFADACRELEIDIIGGDTNLAKEWIINITLLGERSEGKVLTRAGARVGDDIYVTGHLGDSALGLWLLKNKKEGSRFIRQHFEPPCRISVGQKLARTWGVSSMMDISDGLQGDLEHILKASHVSAQIIPNQLPLNPHYMLRCREEKIDPFTLAMTGGEDYELLFTVSPRVKLPYKIDGIPLTKIGKIIPFNPNQKKLKSHGYRHF
ncbi:MAG: thiamine-phosphate kinase [Deltaproteobacteria bacterium]|nr:MAG: thiamine-phosphate kinase [Deltaproteobacteria bacterium]